MTTNRLIRRGVAVAAVTGALLAIGAGGASADDCVNLSRNTDGTQATHGSTEMDTAYGPVLVKGHWVYLGDVWLFISPGTQTVTDEEGNVIADVSGLPGAQGNFTDGKGDGLLEQSGSASDGRRCAVMENGHGMAGECGE